MTASSPSAERAGPPTTKASSGASWLRIWIPPTPEGSVPRSRKTTLGVARSTFATAERSSRSAKIWRSRASLALFSG